ncbi:type IV pilus biogenesis protein PilP [Trinickia fusca]|uniref:Type IV pilus biogenesis protein PilP n=2 Tax=Trinickia fusca TaxID=2419777 RepID=A0A494XK00_9BURK|nr:type IV pilus biogenesis protein PilP [Trinickia fusca]
MQKLQRDNLQLKLELQQAQLKAQIRAANQDGKHAAPDDDGDNVPSVVSLTGVGDEREALLSVPGYGQIMVRAGDALPNHWKVVAIDDGGVVVTPGSARGAKRMRLPFYSDATRNAT